MTARDARRLRAEHQLRTEAGVRGRWLEGAALRTLGFDAAAAIRTRGNAQGIPHTLILSLLKDEPFCRWFDKLTTSDVFWLRDVFLVA